MLSGERDALILLVDLRLHERVTELDPRCRELALFFVADGEVQQRAAGWVEFLARLKLSAGLGELTLRHEPTPINEQRVGFGLLRWGGLGVGDACPQHAEHDGERERGKRVGASTT